MTQQQKLVDILALCAVNLAVIAAQGQKGGPLTLREYIQVRLEALQAVAAAGSCGARRAAGDASYRNQGKTAGDPARPVTARYRKHHSRR